MSYFIKIDMSFIKWLVILYKIQNYLDYFTNQLMNVVLFEIIF